MQFFIDFIKDNQTVSRLFKVVSENPGHQGTIIRFSENFFLALEMRKRYPPELFDDILYRYIDFFPHLFTELPLLFYFPIYSEIEYSIPNITTLHEFHELKRSIPSRFKDFNIKPLEIIISIFNDVTIEKFEKITSEFRNDEDFKIIIERRGRNTLLNSQSIHNPLIGGISISGHNVNSFGTLGGFLKTNKGDIFGLTCSHVASFQKEYIFQPAKYDSSNSKRIGKVILASDLKFCDYTSPCNPECSQDNMDVALIQLNRYKECEFRVNELGAINKLKKFQDIRQGMEVEFNGRTTNKKKQLTIGGLCVSYKVAYVQNLATKYACFTNLIELRGNPIRVFGTNHYFQESPVRAGDSGAWICSNDSEGYSWCGMLISGDVDRGYFLASEHILKWLEDSGYSLTV